MPKPTTTIIAGPNPSSPNDRDLPSREMEKDTSAQFSPPDLDEPPNPGDPKPRQPISEAAPDHVTVRPSRRRDAGTAWLVLLGLLVLATLPLTIELLRPAVFDAREQLAVSIAVETWQRNTAYTSPEHMLAPWTPVIQGRPDVERPPATTWLHVIALRRTMEPGMEPVAQALLWCRIIGVGMTLLLIASVYWAGHSMGGVLTAAMSGLVALSMPVLMFVGRLGTGDVHLAAWVALSIAGALWAMRPMRRSPALPRQFMGWLVCGTGLGMATLTAGPVAIPPVVLPLAAMSMICPRRLGHALGVIAALAVAVLVVTPWSIHVHETMPDGWRQWVGAMEPAGFKGEWAVYGQTVGWRASVTLAVLGFWALWLVPGLLQPFSTSTGEARGPMAVGWSWFVTTALLMLLAPGPALVRPLLLLIAPASLMIGQVMRQYHDLSGEGRHARLWRTSRLLTLTATGVLSIGLPLLAVFEPQLPAWTTQWLGTRRSLMVPMHPGYWVGAGVALLLIATLAGRFALANHPGRALAGWSAWVVVLAVLLIVPLARGELMETPANTNARAAR
ncbi:MAG: hypothetical protein AAGC44_00795 [Planctomycetota bacterium]